jgi:Uma2 family endonuclease
MSLASPSIPPSPSPEPVFRLSVQQYHAMIDAGVLTDDDPVELLEGILVFKMPKKPAHRLVLRKLVKALDKLLPEGWFVQAQEPITLSNGEPEPDAAVIRGTDEDYASRHPGPDDAAMVVEVADTTVQRDRTIKLRSYAGAGIGVYWILNLVDRTLELYTDPDPQAAEPRYRKVSVLTETESVDVVIAASHIGTIALCDLLPAVDRPPRP